MEIVPEAGWQSLAREIAGRTTILIGETDTGKTTMVRYLLGQISEDGYPVALVDADIGQSSLGLPGTVSLGVFRHRIEAEEFAFDHLAYVGTANAARAVDFLATRTAAMVRLAREEDAQSVLVDTTGLVQGTAGRSLKTRELDLVRPDVLVAVEREGELGSLLALISGPRIILLPTSARARIRTPAARARHRQERLLRYFQGTNSLRLGIANLAFTIFGRPAPIQNTGLQPGSVVGLGQAGETRAAGLVEGILEDSLLVRTPLEKADGIRYVATGDMLLEARSEKPVI
jgi:polynucleotide 5'-hydroxyl-kinase GRC3/NOL9